MIIVRQCTLFVFTDSSMHNPVFNWRHPTRQTRARLQPCFRLRTLGPATAYSRPCDCALPTLRLRSRGKDACTACEDKRAPDWDKTCAEPCFFLFSEAKKHNFMPPVSPKLCIFATWVHGHETKVHPSLGMKKVTICIPCYNEEANLPRLYDEVRVIMGTEPGYVWNLLLVDDGSSDGTAGIMQSLHTTDERVTYICLSRNFGKECALMAAIDHAEADAVVLMDADMQDPPALIHEMLRWWEQGYHDVYARRTSRGNESWLRHRGAMTFYRLMERLSRVEMPVNVGDFRLLDRQCVEAMRQLRETERYNKGLFSWIGFRKKEISFDRADRQSGESRWSLWRLAGLAIDGITSFSTAPLRMATIMGAIIALGAACLLLFYMAKTLIWGDPVQGFTTLVSIILFLGGVQLLSIGILGEYIGRIYIESKHRPTYFVKESCGLTKT